MIDSDLPISTSELKQEVSIRLGTDGQAANPPKTVMRNFDDVVSKFGDEKALFQKTDGTNVRNLETLQLFLFHFENSQIPKYPVSSMTFFFSISYSRPITVVKLDMDRISFEC